MGQPRTDELFAGGEASRQDFLAAIVTSSDDAIIGLTRQGVVTSWNPGASRMYGYAAQEIVGQPGTVLCPPDQVAEFTAALEAIARGEHVVHYQTDRRRKDGSTVPVSVTVSPVRDTSGALIGSSSIARDVTEQRRAEACLARQAEDLEQSCRNLEAFSYRVSHDLRAPLGAMAGFSEALLEECHDALGEVGQHYVERIRAGSEQMMTLIDDMLAFSRSSRSVLRFQPVDLSAEVTDIARELREREPGREVTVIVQPGVWVSANRELIRSVLRNLVENAWKFTSRQSRAHIEFGAEPTGTCRLRCWVRDDGAGFDPACADKLFQPFQRLHEASDYPGTGVGLAIARQIIERHGGEVTAAGVPGAGATVYFTLDAEEPA